MAAAASPASPSPIAPPPKRPDAAVLVETCEVDSPAGAGCTGAGGGTAAPELLLPDEEVELLTAPLLELPLELLPLDAAPEELLVLLVEPELLPPPTAAGRNGPLTSKISPKTVLPVAAST